MGVGPTSPESPFVFACPTCRAPLEAPAAGEMRCPNHGISYRRKDGIWRFLTADRAATYGSFLRDYHAVRRAQGRGSHDGSYYRALPFRDLSGRYRREWEIRGRSFRSLLERVVVPMEDERTVPLRVLDLGSGCAWLSNRLATRGHSVAAVDLTVDKLDGLGAHVHYDQPFVSIQADFDRLPLLDSQVELVVYNGSLHYAVDYEVTLGEALRVLRDDGRVVVMDTPIYRDSGSGERMVQEREAAFERAHGFRSDALPSENYLTYDRLERLADQLDLAWEQIAPRYGLAWAARPWVARVLGRREPAAFLVIVGRRRGAER